MSIAQCERCEYGDGTSGSMMCTNLHLTQEEKDRVMQGAYCRAANIVDSTDHGEPWGHGGIEGPSYPF